MVNCQILLLDNTDFEVECDKSEKGQILMDQVCERLNLVEKDYFSLTYNSKDETTLWLDMEKKLRKQLKSAPWIFELKVKFFPSDPLALEEDITKYYLCLQIREDIYSKKLPCSFVTRALLGSYAIQSDLGDYDPDTAGKDGIEYLRGYQFHKDQGDDLLEKIADLHKTHKGQSPAEADNHYLETAKKIAMYGLDTHDAWDSEDVELIIGVCCTGILIYRDKLRVNRFPWPKVLKLSYKRNNFFVKIRPAEFDPYETTIGFRLHNHLKVKALWKSAVEHHAFFRLKESKAKHKPSLFHRFGSKFRYSGRTQYQAKKAAEDEPKRIAPEFERAGTLKSSTMSLDRRGQTLERCYDRSQRKEKKSKKKEKLRPSRSLDDLGKDDSGKITSARREPSQEDGLNLNLQEPNTIPIVEPNDSHQITLFRREQSDEEELNEKVDKSQVERYPHEEGYEDERYTHEVRHTPEDRYTHEVERYTPEDRDTYEERYTHGERHPHEVERHTHEVRYTPEERPPHEVERYGHEVRYTTEERQPHDVQRTAHEVRYTTEERQPHEVERYGHEVRYTTEERHPHEVERYGHEGRYTTEERHPHEVQRTAHEVRYTTEERQPHEVERYGHKGRYTTEERNPHEVQRTTHEVRYTTEERQPHEVQRYTHEVRYAPDESYTDEESHSENDDPSIKVTTIRKITTIKQHDLNDIEDADADNDADLRLSKAIQEAAGFNPNVSVVHETIDSVGVTTNDK